MYDVVLWALTYMITMFLAYGLKRLGVFHTEDRKVFANLIFNLTLPAMLVSSFSAAWRRWPDTTTTFSGFSSEVRTRKGCWRPTTAMLEASSSNWVSL